MEFVSSKLRKAIPCTITFLFLIHLIPNLLLANIREVIFAFPSSASNPTGLTRDGQYLWNADTGTQWIYKIAPSNGSMIHSISSPPAIPRLMV